MNLRDYIEKLDKSSNNTRHIELIIVEHNQEFLWKTNGVDHPYTAIIIEDIIETESPLVPDGILLRIKYLTNTYHHKAGDVCIQDLTWASTRQVVQEKKTY